MAAVPHKVVGPGGVGYAFLNSEVGLCVRHRDDGARRLACGLSIYYGLRTFDDCCTRLAAIDLVLQDDLSDDVAILVSQKWWQQTALAARQERTEELRPLNNVTSLTSTTWRDHQAHELAWKGDLCWPTVIQPMANAYHLNTGTAKIWIWDGDGIECAVNSRWLAGRGRTWVQKPILGHDHEDSWYFPGK